MRAAARALQPAPLAGLCWAARAWHAWAFRSCTAARQGATIKASDRAPCRDRHGAAQARTAAAPRASAIGDAAAEGGACVIVAFGGNALLKRGEPLTLEVQQRNARAAAAAVCDLVGAGYRVVVTHGNGPQVGLLALQDPKARLEVLDAESEGQLGFILELELNNALQGRRQVAALLTQVVVDPADPAFARPTKQVGPRYTMDEARALAADKGWAVAPDGDAMRRVVPSPLPHDIVEWRSVQVLLQAGVIVVCCGGGGIPVAAEPRSGQLRGVEAVVDKDEASALLGIRLRADWLLMLTGAGVRGPPDADAIYDPAAWPKEQRPLPSPIPCSQLQQMSFASGSMAPKVAAACRFASATGGRAAVGSIRDALAILQGRAGTIVTAG